MHTIYANDIDKHAATWLHQLPLGITHVDTQSIKDVTSDDVAEYTQCHFFAGIGGWPLALTMAGWPSDREVWTGSCPCQPFSAAGKRKGTQDERHLWPEFRRLIDECRPSTVFGEQVASKDGRNWLSVVRTDLEAMGYAVGAADLCAAGVGAPHIRQRLFWVANCKGINGQRSRFPGERIGSIQLKDRGHRSDGGRANSRCERQGSQRTIPGGARSHTARGSWSDVEYIPCRDGKARPVKPGVRLLAHGVPGRVAQLCGLGNAIVPQVAAEFIAAFLETEMPK